MCKTCKIIWLQFVKHHKRKIITIQNTKAVDGTKNTGGVTKNASDGTHRCGVARIIVHQYDVTNH